MSTKFTLSKEYIEKAMQSEGVRYGIRTVAERVQRAAENIAAAEDYPVDVWVEEGTRPKGRPYASVTINDAAQEYGTRLTPRRRILGRAAEEAR